MMSVHSDNSHAASSGRQATAPATPAASSNNETYQRRWDHALLPALGSPTLALVEGNGATVTDADGAHYTDMLSGIAVNALGHAHPAVVHAVTKQISTLGHVSNLFAAEPPVRLAERLLQLAGQDGRVFFANSGAEANEAAFKIARSTGREEVLTLEGSFHGRTMGALALTGQPGKQDGFHPLPGGVRHLPFGDVDALRAAVSRDTAAVLLEPIQGEFGVRPLPEGYLRAAREITAEHGALLILDEIQTGTGRTGHWFAHQAADQLGTDPAYAPDVVTLAKGIGGGLPLGACLAFHEAAQLLQPGQHASTFGGNPVCCAAGLAVLDTLDSEGLLTRARQLGEHVATTVRGWQHPAVVEVRGAGLLLGMELTVPAADVAAAARRRGFLLGTAGGQVLRLAPPLVVTDEQVDSLLAALPDILDEAADGHAARQHTAAQP